MDPGVKNLIAVAILAAGIALALLFRHQTPQSRPTAPDPHDSLVLREGHAPPLGNQADLAEPPTAHIPYPAAVSNRKAANPPARSAPSATAATTIEPSQPPPPLPRSYPHSRYPTTASRQRTSTAGEPSRPLDSGDSANTHKIVDGDTLAALAERYLGSADRLMEIYEANRDRLQDPEVLPIGVQLRIPSGKQGALSSPNLMPRQPLVPISSDSQHRPTGREPTTEKQPEQ